jgi:hypothetical protein
MASPALPTPEEVARHEAVSKAEKSARLNLGEFLASGPLYTQFAFNELAAGLTTLPKTIQLYCPNGECSKVQTFERTALPNTDRGWGATVTYKCRNCEKHNQRYMYVWQGGWLLEGRPNS